MNLSSKIHTFLVNRNTQKIKKTAKQCGVRFICNSRTSYVTPNTIIGDDVSFNGMHIMGKGNVYIGSHFHCGVNCFIISDNHDYDHGKTIPYDNCHSIPKDVYIEDNVWLGVGVIILPGSHIGEGAIIQAGSVVLGDIPKGAIAGGHPAKVFKYRDMKHYNMLKEKKAFVVNEVR